MFNLVDFKVKSVKSSIFELKVSRQLLSSLCVILNEEYSTRLGMENLVQWILERIVDTLFGLFLRFVHSYTSLPGKTDEKTIQYS